MQSLVCINLVCLVLLTLEFLFAGYFLQLMQYIFIVLYEVKSNDFTCNGAIFLTIYFIAFDFTVLSYSNFNL